MAFHDKIKRHFAQLFEAIVNGTKVLINNPHITLIVQDQEDPDKILCLSTDQSLESPIAILAGVKGTAGELNFARPK